MRPEWKGHIIRIALGLVILVLVIYFYWPISCADLLPKEGGVYVLVHLLGVRDGQAFVSTEFEGQIERDDPVYAQIVALFSEYTCHRSLVDGGKGNHWVKFFYDAAYEGLACLGTDTLQVNETHYYVVYGKGRGQEMMDALCEILQQSKEPA